MRLDRMRGKLLLTLLLSFLVLLPACGDAYSDKPDIVGYVMNKSDKSILVVSKDAQDFSANDGVSEYYDAVSLANSPTEVQIGEQVRVWYDGPVAESYPMQATIGKIDIIPSPKPEGANLTEAGALRQAIEDQVNIAVKSIKYDQKLDLWKIEFKDIHEDNVWGIEVKDS